MGTPRVLGKIATPGSVKMVFDNGNGVFYDGCGIDGLMVMMQLTFKMNGWLIKMMVDG